jgi:pyruvate dehydrogenase E2 component (dihydrolipoamide acetyltransferase)
MARQFRLPELGENVDSAELIKIMVSVGDKLALDQPVLELETDKADFELPSTLSGTIHEIHVRAGERIKVGQLIFTLDEDGTGSVDGASASKPAPEAAAPALEERSVPDSGVSEAEAARPAEPPIHREAPGEGMAEPAVSPKPVPASPTVRRLARELGVSIDRVQGSGAAGRILMGDVKSFVKQGIAGAGERPTHAGPRPVPLPDFSRWGAVERRDMTGIRRKTAESMSYAWSSIPHVTHYESADITELELLRSRFAPNVEAAGAKLTVTAIAVKVVAGALKAFPNFASSLDVEKEQIIFKKYCHIGVAVDTDRGLIVPVIRDADRKNIRQLAVELAQLAEKTRNKKITLEELEGAVFTITNLGGIGGTQFSPIVHAPEVAILGISRARREPAVVDGRIEPRLVLPLSLSYDHRVIDGAEAARFLRWVAEALEQPFLLSLEG